MTPGSLGRCRQQQDKNIPVRPVAAKKREIKIGTPPVAPPVWPAAEDVDVDVAATQPVRAADTPVRRWSASRVLRNRQGASRSPTAPRRPSACLDGVI